MFLLKKKKKKKKPTSLKSIQIIDIRNNIVIKGPLLKIIGYIVKFFFLIFLDRY